MINYKELYEKSSRERLQLAAKQVKICDLVREWEEGANPFITLRKISDILKGEI